MAAEKEGPAGPFKRVLTLAMKTIADDPELHRDLRHRDAGPLRATRPAAAAVAAISTGREVAITRGLADSFALRLANHRDDIHAKYRPEGK